jgi:glycosyltransferase involved in cell wall biosynthesis
MVKDSSQLDLFHHHSLWMLPNHYASVVGRRHNKPSLFTIHGALEPWALSHSYWKKQLIGRWFQFRDLREATCLHVNSRKELEQLRKLGFRQPIAMIPNGINPSEFLNLKKNQELSSAYPRLQGKRLVLFMARLHQKKGIEHLLQAWSRITAEFADWHLVLAGPDDGFELAARKLVGQLSIGDSVSLVGQLQGNMRLAALAEAHVFTQPSHSEGFSMSILEAMASGLPVLLTPGCNFPEVATAGAGIEVASDVEGTEMGLRAILGKSDEERQTMGAQGKMLIEKHFTWDRVAEQTEKLYRWLLGTSQKPAFVET